MPIVIYHLLLYPKETLGGAQVTWQKPYSLLLLCLVLLCAVIKKLLVHLHEELQCIVDQPMNCPAKEQGKENKSWWAGFLHLSQHQQHRQR